MRDIERRSVGREAPNARSTTMFLHRPAGTSSLARGLPLIFGTRLLMLFEIAAQGFARAFDMGLKKRAGSSDLALRAQFEKLGVLGRGALHAVGQRELKARMPVAFLQEVRHDG